MAFFDTLIGATLSEKAHQLDDHWLTDGPGLVLVVVTDTGKWKIGWEETSEIVTGTGKRVPVIDKRDIAPQQKVELVTRMQEVPRMEAGSVEGAEKLLEAMLSSLEAAFAPSEQDNMGRKYRLRTVALGFALLSAMVLAVIGVGVLLRRADRKKADRLIFPDVTVRQRLGASAGGGKISSRSFGNSRPTAEERDA